MIFNKVLGIKREESYAIVSREAVRAIIMEDNKLLMIHTNKGDYKFPGGGVNQGETHLEAVKREVMEESGFIVESVLEKIGVTIERRYDKYDDSKIFEMTSYYYLCKLSGERTKQKLDDYEADMGFEPKWIIMEEALSINKKYLENHNDNYNTWVNRENYVLTQLKKNI